jgi:hypothetical protein
MIQHILLLVDNPVAAEKANEIFCGNMQVLLFEDEEYKWQKFGNYNICKKKLEPLCKKN